MRKFEFAMQNGEKMFEDAQLPMYATRHSAGADFFCAKTVTIPSKNKKPVLVNTGIKADMEDDEVLYIFNRSSMPKRGLVLANGVGVIDKDYYGNESNDGNIMFAFFNVSDEDVTIQVGERIGQGVFQKFLRPDNAIILDEERIGGFGSTLK